MRETKRKLLLLATEVCIEYNVMPFGLANAPSVFQELVSVVLQDLGKIAMAYLDNIIIFSPSMEEHIKHVQLVFDRSRQHQLKLKISKCKFMQGETQYLGFVINRQGITTDPDKVQVIKNMNPPSCVRELRSFIGMCSYYRRFIPNFSAKAKPLIKLTRKFAKFEWNKECQAAFDHLKECLTTSPLLSYPDTSKPYILYTDASDDCIGACL